MLTRRSLLKGSAAAVALMALPVKAQESFSGYWYENRPNGEIRLYNLHNPHLDFVRLPSGRILTGLQAVAQGIT